MSVHVCTCARVHVRVDAKKVAMAPCANATFVLLTLGLYPTKGVEVDTLLNLLTVKHNISPSRLTHFVVVGNGPLTDGDRNIINSHEHDAVILRFNDENNYYAGEPIHVHAIRHPSWQSRKNGLVEWHIAPFQEWIPKHSNVTTITYEAQYGEENEANPSETLFPSTCSDESCWINHTKYGSSTGGIVLSKLNEHPLVRNITVFGMNWNGNPDHIDFLFPKMVHLMCTKCDIHNTHTNDYGQNGTVMALSALGSIAILGCIIFGWIIDLEATAMYRYIFVQTDPSLETEPLKPTVKQVDRIDPVTPKSPVAPVTPVTPVQPQQATEPQLPLLPG